MNKKRKFLTQKDNFLKKWYIIKSTKNSVRGFHICVYIIFLKKELIPSKRIHGITKFKYIDRA